MPGMRVFGQRLIFAQAVKEQSGSGMLLNRMRNLRMRLDIIHAEAQEKIEALREKVHPLSRPCADLVELQTMISGQLATLASDSKNLKTAVEKLQSQVEKLHDKK